VERFPVAKLVENQYSSLVFQGSDISIVSPIGTGLDDDTVQAVARWQFSPGKCHDTPCAVHARVIFDIGAPTTRLGLP